MALVQRKPILYYLVLCALAAVWMDFTRIHLNQNSDSIVPVLVSLQRWTPFYWDQSRFGMLVPLLALPFRHPLVNLLVQDGLMIFAGLAAIGLLVRFFVRSRAWFAAACVSCTLFLVCMSESCRCDYFLAQPYGVSYSLGIGGLLLVDGSRTRARWFGALILLGLATWVNVSAGPGLVLMVLARWLVILPKRRRPPIELLALVASCALFGIALEQRAGFSHNGLLRPVSPSDWWLACTRLVTNVKCHCGLQYHQLLFALMGAVSLAFMLTRTRRWKIAVPSLGLILAGAFLVAMMGASSWTTKNQCLPRYIYVAILACQGGLCAGLVLTWRRLLPRSLRQSAAIALPLGILTATCWTYGSPSLATVRASLDNRFGADTESVLAARSTHVAGNYWRVWTTVYHANLQLHDRGESRTVWGVGLRCRSTMRLWRPRPGDECRIAVFGIDAADERFVLANFPSLHAKGPILGKDIEIRCTDSTARADVGP